MLDPKRAPKTQKANLRQIDQFLPKIRIQPKDRATPAAPASVHQRGQAISRGNARPAAKEDIIANGYN